MELTETPLEIQHLSFRYSKGDHADVFSDVSFSIGQGEIFTLIGPNGTGKSTLIRCIGGLLTAHSGEILIEGEAISRMETARTARIIGYVPQTHLPTFPFPVREVVVMGRTPHMGMFSSPSDADMRIAEDAMDTVGLSHLEDRPCTEISGGEWQLVLIARAMTQEPRILLLDEPTSHLDLGNQMKILHTIKRLSGKGLAILLATHFPDHAFLISGRVGVMKDGGIPLLGSPEEVITEETMRSVYGVNVRISTLTGDGGRRICVPLLSSDRSGQ
ncbi:MAG: ABC transporter ATP-binding protein [Methanolinea sp.]